MVLIKDCVSESNNMLLYSVLDETRYRLALLINCFLQKQLRYPYRPKTNAIES